MALPKEFRRQSAPTPISEPQLAFVPQSLKEKITLLRDPETRFFYDAIGILAKNERINILLSFPPSANEKVSSTQLVQAITPEEDTKQRNAFYNLDRLIQTNLSEYVISTTEEIKKYSLNSKGSLLRKAAEIASQFLANKNGTSSFIDPSELNQTMPAIGKSAILMYLAQENNRGIRQAEIVKSLHLEHGATSRLFESLQKNGLIKIDSSKAAYLTSDSLPVFEHFLFPIAELTGFSPERLIQIKKALGFPLDRNSRTISSQEAYQQRRTAMQNVTQMMQRQEENISDPFDSDDVYLAQIRRYPRELTKEQTRIIFEYIQAGSNLHALFTDKQFLATIPKDEIRSMQIGHAYSDALGNSNGQDTKSLITFFANCHLQFVAERAREFVNRGLPYKDLVQEGNFGLLRAIERNDYTRPERFLTFAEKVVKGSMLNAIEAKARMIRLPHDQEITVRRLYREQKHAESHENIKAIAERAGIPYENALELLAIVSGVKSLDEPLKSGEDTSSLLEILSENKSSFSLPTTAKGILPGLLNDLAEFLNEDEMFIVKATCGHLVRRTGGNYTNEDMAKHLHIGEDHVRHKKTDVFRKIRGNTDFMIKWEKLFK